MYRRYGSVRLAFIAALQYLPPRQRAVLVLRDVLCFSAREVAQMLDSSTAGVNSALQRARAALAELGAEEGGVAEPDLVAQREVVDAYVRAFEAADIEALKKLLVDDVMLEMPPVPLWYEGRDEYTRFISHVFSLRGRDWRMKPTTANGQPAVAAYHLSEDGTYTLHTLQVFTVNAHGLHRNVVFQAPAVFAAFELPAVLHPAR